MRRILVEQARRRNAAKRGGQAGREELDEAALAAPEPAEDVLALDDALTQLATVDPVAARLVQLRFFGGLNMTEAAEEDFQKLVAELEPAVAKKQGGTSQRH
jgi:hypothetical protein